MSEKFVRRHRFRRTKLDYPIYVQNVDRIINYIGLIVDIVEVEIFFKDHKKRISIDIIEGEKWSIILGISWPVCHNPKIDWKTREVQIIRYLNKCEKKWKRRRQIKPGWQKQKEKEEKEEIRRLAIDKEITIVRIVKEKEEELDKEKDLIELRLVEEIVPK